MAENVFEFTDANFQKEVLESEEPVVVDFWAPWCGPCKMLTPMIEELAGDYAGRVRVGKMNIDQNPQIATQLGVNAIPTVVVYKKGEIVDRVLGIPPKTRFTTTIDDCLNG
ncbi:MAG: thioredoxin [Planctomycetota bacterium]|nr:thioredoxin [Planctomycetota bacterium]MDA1177480.1 thioredoxin [Planctomycetota bacterium]